mmetsp:Transcript_44304/g.139786  ORF Transcript_44304/g.139786 Transcript_44304/m.139786 type:complete len:272 (+) Transcript_44304:724-1539(+)
MAAAVAERTSSSSLRMSSRRRETTLAMTGGEAEALALPSTTSRASMKLSWTPPSLLLAPASRSLSRGSTRGLMRTRKDRARMARPRTTLLGSESDLTKVVCSWGRKGFIMIPPLTRRRERVLRIALLTCQGNLSPMMRIRGPDICTTIGFSAASPVACTRIPSPAAACSRSSGVDPCMSAWRKKGRRGARPLVRLNPGTPVGGATAARDLTSSNTRPTYSEQLTAGALSSSSLSARSIAAVNASKAACACTCTASSSSPNRCTSDRTISAL